MEITRSGIAAIVVLCGAAGAGGAYVATRSNVEPAAVVVSAATTDTAVEGLPSEARDAAPDNAQLDSVRLDSAGRAAAESGPVVVPVTRPRTVTPREASGTSAPAAEHSTAPPATAPVDTSSSTARVSESPQAPEPVVIAAPEPELEELIVASDVVLGLQMDNSVSSETARVEDQVVAHVTREIRVADRTAIPAGAKAYGEVTFVERGGRLRERARLGVRFSSLLLPDGTRLPIATDVVFRDGDTPSRESAAKIGGGAIGGAIIGGILGGGKGAILGGTAGAGAGTAAVFAGGRNSATLSAGTPVTVRLTDPVRVSVDR